MFTFKKFDNRDSNRIIIVDNLGGSYVNVAISLSKYFQKTYYHSVQQNPFPVMSWASVGTGYSEIIVLDSFWDHLDDFDIIIFPDIYFESWGTALRNMGKKVWGGSKSEELETNRKLFKQELTNNGMPVAPTISIIGIDNLLDFLKDKTDKWIKISYYRGDMETTHWININYNSVQFNNLKNNLGPLSNSIEFLIEDGIDCVAEIGYDGYSINGEFPNNCIFGLEVKDCGYIGKSTTKNELPKPVSLVNKQFGPVLEKYNHQGFYSTEIRYTENGLAYYTDPCMRAGSPPSNTYLDLINNWDEIIVGGVNGELVEPEFSALYGVEIILKSDYINKGFLPVKFPTQFRNNIKLKGSFIRDGLTYVVPFKYSGFEMCEFGSVVVTGDNLEEVMNQALEIASQVEAYGLTYNVNALDIAAEQIANIEDKLNIKF